LRVVITAHNRITRVLMMGRNRTAPGTDLQFPCNLEAERALLGAVLLDNSASGAVFDLVPEDFSLPEHKVIFRFLNVLHGMEQSPDLLLLTEALKQCGSLEEAGGVGYLARLVDGVARVSNVRHYAEIVREKARLRELAHLGHALEENALTADADASGITERLIRESEALALRTQTGLAKIRGWSDIPTLDRLPAAGIEWLVPGLLPRAGVVLLAGEAGCYKSWLAMSLARALATGSSFLNRNCMEAKILYLDRENPASVWSERTRVLGITPSDNLRVWGGWISQQPPAIGDLLLRRVAVERKPMIVVDSFVRFHNADENSASEMACVMASLRDLANAGASVLVLHHRAKSETSKFRGSTDIQAGVDMAFLIQRQEGGALRLSCFKNRFGQEFLLTIRPDFEGSGDFVLTASPVEAKQKEAEDRILKVIEQRPGVTQGEVVEATSLPRELVRTTLQRREGALWNAEKGLHNSTHYRARTTPFAIEV
jgi:hypothetical protein